MHVIDSWVASRCMSQLTAIDTPADVLRRPLKRIGVPIILRIKVLGVLMRLKLLLALTIDHVHGEGI